MLKYLYKIFLKKSLDKIKFLFKFRWSLQDDLRSFFYHALFRQEELINRGLKHPSINYFEFGVGWGWSLVKFVEALKTFCAQTGKDFYSFRIYCFDSFEGLPKKKSLKDDSVEWQNGSFAHTIDDIKKELKKIKVDLNKGSIKFIKGFFEDSLNPELRKKLTQHAPSIVNVDCDYYSSTKTVLEWLRPILRSGTLFHFDDIWSFFGHPDLGQLAAIREFNEINEGHLVPYPKLGRNSHVYIYSRKDYEFHSQQFKKE